MYSQISVHTASRPLMIYSYSLSIRVGCEGMVPPKSRITANDTYLLVDTFLRSFLLYKFAKNI